MTNFRLSLFFLSFLILNPFVRFLNDIFPSNERIKSTSSEIILDNVDNNFDLPVVSGQVTNLPWKNNKDFLELKEKHKTPLLLAAYCAVLKDPLPGEGFNVDLASSGMKGLLLKANDTFSMNSSLGPYSKSKGYKEGASYSNGQVVMTEGGGVCKIATITYNLAVLSDLEIVERYNHSMPINYVPYGQDATVFYGVKDFKFKNTSEDNILIWAEMIDNRLYMAFYGSKKPPLVEWSHEVSNIVDPPTKYIENPDLDKGQTNIITQGLKGANVKSIVTLTYPDGRIKVKNMGISNYRPLPKIIEGN